MKSKTTLLMTLTLMTSALMTLIHPSDTCAQVRVTITVESADELSNPNEDMEVVIGEPAAPPAHTAQQQPPTPPASPPASSAHTAPPPHWAPQPALPPGYAPQGYAPRYPQYPPLANRPPNPEAERLRLEISSIRLGGSVAMIPIGFGLAGMLSYGTALSAVLCYGDCAAPVVLGVMAAGALALGIAGIVRLSSRKRRRNRLRSQLRAMDAAVVRW